MSRAAPFRKRPGNCLSLANGASLDISAGLGRRDRPSSCSPCLLSAFLLISLVFLCKREQSSPFVSRSPDRCISPALFRASSFIPNSYRATSPYTHKVWSHDAQECRSWIPSALGLSELSELAHRGAAQRRALDERDDAERRSTALVARLQRAAADRRSWSRRRAAMRPAVAACAARAPIVVVNPRQVRAFAQALGRTAKPMRSMRRCSRCSARASPAAAAPRRRHAGARPPCASTATARHAPRERSVSAAPPLGLCARPAHHIRCSNAASRDVDDEIHRSSELWRVQRSAAQRPGIGPPPPARCSAQLPDSRLSPRIAALVASPVQCTVQSPAPHLSRLLRLSTRLCPHNVSPPSIPRNPIPLPPLSHLHHSQPPPPPSSCNHFATIKCGCSHATRPLLSSTFARTYPSSPRNS